jgi:hypothetical protein
MRRRSELLRGREDVVAGDLTVREFHISAILEVKCSSVTGPAVSQHDSAESKFGPVDDEQAMRTLSVKNRRTGSAVDDSVLAALDDDSGFKLEDRRRHLNLHRRGTFEQGDEHGIGADVGGERAAARLLLRKGL